MASIEDLVQEGRRLRLQGQLDESLAVLQRAVDSTGDDPDLLGELGNTLHRLRRFDEAAHVYRRVVDASPDDLHARLSLSFTLLELRRPEDADAEMRRALATVSDPREALTPVVRGLLLAGRREQALLLLRHWLSIAPRDPVPLHLVAAGTGQGVPKRASVDFVKAEFDQFAETYDKQLAKLGYRGPTLIAESLAAHVGEPHQHLVVLDAGCGTGLCGPLLRPFANTLIGIDLSTEMLSRARERGVYDDLQAADLITYLAGEAARFDVIVLADTAIYFGELGSLMSGLIAALRPGGCIAFTIELLSGSERASGFQLNPSGRYSHTRSYVERCAAQAGLAIASVVEANLRTERAAQVSTLVIVATKTEVAKAIAAPGNVESPEIEALRRRVTTHPRDAESHFRLGEQLLRSGRASDAAASFRFVLEMHPELEPAHFNLGNALFAAKKFREAAGAYERAAQLSPEAGTFNNLGNTLAALGEADRATMAFLRAIELEPNFTRAHNNLGRVHATTGEHEEAIKSLQRAVELEPSNWRAYVNLAVTQTTVGRLDAAAESCETAGRLAPDEADVHLCRGRLGFASNRFGDAMASLIRALELRPDDPAIFNSLGQVNHARGRASEAWFCYLRALQIDPTLSDVHSNWLRAMQADENVSAGQLHQEATVWANSHAAVKQLDIHPAISAIPRRRRIGYVSPDFGENAVGRWIEPVLRHHNRDEFEITCYANQAWADDLTARLLRHADRWRDVAHLTDAALAKQIREDGIDVLVDLSGHSPSHRLLTFARRPAPVQVTWLGSAGTTGLKQIDYVLGDRHTIPPDHDSLFSERPYRLSHGFICFDPPSDAPAISPLPALQSDSFTFGSLAGIANVTASVARLWAQVLHAVPRSRLRLQNAVLADPSVREDLMRLFVECEVDVARIQLSHDDAGREPLVVYRDIDIALDTFPCNDAAVAAESLWMGVPVLTLQGDRPAGRATSSFLAALGLDRFIANSRADYIAKAAELSDNRAQLAGVRDSLRQTMLSSPLCDASRFTRELEAVFQTMWQAAVSR